ncbi:unnamed protein product [Caretta caretta]
MPSGLGIGLQAPPGAESDLREALCVAEGLFAMAEAGRPENPSEESAADEFGDIIRSRSDEREDVQKKTFTKWVNAQFAKHMFAILDSKLSPTQDLLHNMDNQQGALVLQVFDVWGQIHSCALDLRVFSLSYTKTCSLHCSSVKRRKQPLGDTPGGELSSDKAELV